MSLRNMQILQLDWAELGAGPKAACLRSPGVYCLLGSGAAGLGGGNRKTDMQGMVRRCPAAQRGHCVIT